MSECDHDAAREWAESVAIDGSRLRNSPDAKNAALCYLEKCQDYGTLYGGYLEANEIVAELRERLKQEIAKREALEIRALERESVNRRLERELKQAKAR